MFILKYYQKLLIDLFKDKFKIYITHNGNLYISVASFTILCSENKSGALNIPANMTLQHQTLILSIYTSIFEKLNMSQSLLLLCDELVLCGLYNLKFNPFEFDVLYLQLSKEIEKFPIIVKTINEFDVQVGYYGLDSKYIPMLTNHYTPSHNVVYKWINENEERICHIFTTSRFINMCRYKPEDRLVNIQDFALYIIQHINNSKFLHVYNDNYNQPINSFNYTSKSLLKVYNQVEDFTAINKNKDFLYTVIPSYKFQSTENYSINTFFAHVYEAVNIASEFEHGIVVVFPIYGLVENKHESLVFGNVHYRNLKYTKTRKLDRCFINSIIMTTPLEKFN